MDTAIKTFIGIGKTKFNSSVCLLPEDPRNVQVWLTERSSRKKASGEWPFYGVKAVDHFVKENNLQNLVAIAENRDVQLPELFEEYLNNKFPFYEYLKKHNLQKYSKKFNQLLTTENHHEAHAYAALAMSPFEKSIIVVIDGAGNQIDDGSGLYEECSVYLQEAGRLKLVFKRGANFFKSQKIPGQTFSNGVGGLYEKMSEFIFKSSTSSGKVMGLAPFGTATQIEDRIRFQENLNWENAFSGITKKEWEESKNYKLFCDLAASVQCELEKDVNNLLVDLRKKYPGFSNLILTGGCALNCTNNAKIKETKLFEKIYVLPFPGDESISFGLANLLRLKNNPERWSLTPFEIQTAYLGPVDSVKNVDWLLEKFKEKGIHFHYSENILSEAVNDLIDGKVIGWFQGRSEAGPRALGNRSILARPDRPGLKNYLNANIKFRESFRPYGCSIIHEYGDEYFEVEKGFDNPFMSFAVKIKAQYKDLLKEVSHIDGTSRMQTVRSTQNKMFYDLIKMFGEKTNVFCLLNTSLNVMGEPVVETVDDAISLFENTPIDSMYIGNFKLVRH